MIVTLIVINRQSVILIVHDSANDSEEQEVDSETTVNDQVSYTDNF